MSLSKRDVVGLAYEAYERRSVDDPALRAMTADGFKFHMRPGWPGKLVYTQDEMTDIWADLDETFDDFEMTFEVLFETDEHVVVRFRQSTRLRDSESRMVTTGYHVWRFRDGKAAEAWIYGQEEEALEAVGRPRQAMSREDVEQAKAAFAAWQTGGVEAILDFLAEDVDYRPLDESPVRGRVGVREYYARWLEPWERYTVTAKEYLEAGDAVVVGFTVSGRGRESGIEVSMDLWSVFWIRDAKTTRWDEYTTKAEALHAASRHE